jgi:hypothetical protein
MSERQNVTRLIRVLAIFVLVPTLTIGGSLILYSWQEHWLHASGFAVLAVAAVVAFAQAPRIAARFVAENA